MVAAALRNALRVTGKTLPEVRIVVSGVGAAGTAIIKLLQAQGARNIVGCDRNGAVHPGSVARDDMRRWLQQNTNPDGLTGTLVEVLKGADVFIGVSAPNLLQGADIATMATDAIVFALANPVPEVDPLAAREHAAVVATGRSDFSNQINNVLAFPGFFRGLLDTGASDITQEMLIAAAEAIADAVTPEELNPSYIVPSVFDPAVAPAVAAAIRQLSGAAEGCRHPRRLEVAEPARHGPARSAPPRFVVKPAESERTVSDTSTDSAAVEVRGPAVPRSGDILTTDAVAFVADLQRRFGRRRDELLASAYRTPRRGRPHRAAGLPARHRADPARDWVVAAAPADLVDRRVEITGPPEPKMAINALNSGAKVWLADLEDANTPHWSNVIGGQVTLFDAIRRRLEFTSPEGKAYRLVTDRPLAVIVARPRGWHFDERHLFVDGAPAVGALVDFGLYFFHNATGIDHPGQRSLLLS